MNLFVSYRFIISIMLALVCTIILRYALRLDTQAFVFEAVMAGLLLFLALAVVLNVTRRSRKLIAAARDTERSSTGTAVFTLRSTAPIDEAENSVAELLSDRRWKRNRIAGITQFIRQKGMAGPLGSLIFHVGLIITLIGVAISFLASSSAMFALTEGERLTPDESVLRERAQGLLSKNLADQGYEFALLEFDRDYRLGLTTAPSALIEVKDRGRKVRQRVHVNEALELEDGSNLHRADLWGYSVAVLIDNPSGERIFSGFVRLAVNIEEENVRHADGVALPDGTTITFELFPDHAIVDGVPISRSSNLENPVLYAYLSYTSDITEKLIIPAGEENSTGGWSIAFPALREWSQFSLSHDPGEALLFFGAWVAVAGLAFRLLFTHSRTTVSLTAVDGETQIALLHWRERYRSEHPDELDHLFNKITTVMNSAASNADTNAHYRSMEGQG